MPAEFFKLFVAAWAFAAVYMMVVFAISRRINNTGIVDVAWSYGFAPVAILYAACGYGDPARRWLIAGMAMLWAARLGTHILMRVKKSHPKEDERYHKLREEWGAQEKQKMFGFFQLQAALLVVLTVPFLLSCLNVNGPEQKAYLNINHWSFKAGVKTVHFSIFELAGLVIWFIALAGESLADYQLKAFKADPNRTGKVCQRGLWHYSRHPNYFFEWLIWMAYFVFALGSPWGWITIYCPALMLFFLVKVTGIPMTEELSVKNRGDEYREYQRTTSAFVPWFPKK